MGENERTCTACGTILAVDIQRCTSCGLAQEPTAEEPAIALDAPAEEEVTSAPELPAEEPTTAESAPVEEPTIVQESAPAGSASLTETQIVDTQPPAQSSAGKWILIAAVALLVIAGLAIGGYFLFSDDDKKNKRKRHSARGDDTEEKVTQATPPVVEEPAAPNAPSLEETVSDNATAVVAPAPAPAPDDAAEEDPPDLESDDSLVEPSALDAELVPDEPKPEPVIEGSHEIFNTSGDLKAPWLALKAGPASGDKYKMLAEMPDGTQLNVVEMGFGKRGQWWYVRIMSGEHKGTQGYAHSKWIRER